MVTVSKMKMEESRESIHSYAVHPSISNPTLQVWALPPPNARPANWPMSDQFWKHDTTCDWSITGSGLTTDYTPHRGFKDSFLGCFSGCFQLSSFSGHLSTNLTSAVYILANLQLCKEVHNYLKFNIQFICSRATLWCRLVVLHSYWALNIQRLVGPQVPRMLVTWAIADHWPIVVEYYT